MPIHDTIQSFFVISVQCWICKWHLQPNTKMHFCDNIKNSLTFWSSDWILLVKWAGFSLDLEASLTSNHLFGIWTLKILVISTWYFFRPYLSACTLNSQYAYTNITLRSRSIFIHLFFIHVASKTQIFQIQLLSFFFNF